MALGELIGLYLALVALPRPGAPPLPFDYADPIGRVGKQPSAVDLRECVRSVQSFGAQRAITFARFRRAIDSGRRPVILLEVGNPGYPRYLYVLTEGGSVVSGLLHGDEKVVDVTTRPLGDRIRALNGEGVRKLRSDASESVHDEACYLLTVVTQREERQVAIYATAPSGPTRRLLDELIPWLEGVEAQDWPETPSRDGPVERPR